MKTVTVMVQKNPANAQDKIACDRAEEVAGVHGLVATPRLRADNTFAERGEWTVTHTQSGRQLLWSGQSLRSKAAAKALIREVAPLADWTASMGELRDEVGLAGAVREAILDVL